MRKLFSIVVFIIDNFDLIDGISFDFLKELLSEDLVLNRSKFIILNRSCKPGMGMITSPLMLEENYLDLSIAPFTPSQVETFIKQYSNTELSKDFINLTIKISGGNPSMVEQLILLKKDVTRCNSKNINFDSLESIIEYRLNFLKQEDWKAYRSW